jgi:two-component system, NarL family, sensor histidine kinase UhpB
MPALLGWGEKCRAFCPQLKQVLQLAPDFVPYCGQPAQEVMMRLLSHLILRLLGVVLLCLSLAVVWVVVDTHRTLERETAGSADRMGRHLEALYWQKLVWRNGLSKETLLPIPDWKTLATQSILSPGVCVTFTPPGATAQKLCSQVEALGPLPPQWFSETFSALMGPPTVIERPLSLRHGEMAGHVMTEADAGGALRQAWEKVSTVVGVAVIMAGAIALLAAVMIGHALLPASAIISALHRLERGDLATRLPKFDRAEFNFIARAFNNLAAKLSKTNAERNALTTRLFEVQEEERRALARDLHDEFGQSLSATTALATLIEGNAPQDRQDIAADARAILRTQNQMMKTLRSTLVRLRSQNVEEVGLEASLRQLVADCNSQTGKQTVFRLNIAGELAALHKQVAVDLYRIAQECLTNAARHGSPSEVMLSVERAGEGREVVSLTVEDNGGGDAEQIGENQGFGIMGMRERLAALGGYLSIGNVAHGVRVCASIPLGTLGDSGEMSGAHA